MRKMPVRTTRSVHISVCVWINWSTQTQVYIGIYLFNSHGIYIYICVCVYIIFIHTNHMLILWYWGSLYCGRTISIDPFHKSHNASNIPQCTIFNRNVHTCAYFCYTMVHCGIWCIVEFGHQVYTMTADTLDHRSLCSMRKCFNYMHNLSIAKFLKQIL